MKDHFMNIKGGEGVAVIVGQNLSCCWLCTKFEPLLKCFVHNILFSLLMQCQVPLTSWDCIDPLAITSILLIYLGGWD